MERRSKYGNRKATEDGYTFDSQAEWRRYQQLKLMQFAGVIHGLAVHPSWPLLVNGVRIGRYVADFSYCEHGGIGPVVEDVKGVRTAAYLLKKRLMLACQGIEIREVDADAV